MFTGIIQAQGSLVSLKKKIFPEMVVEFILPEKVAIGDSVAVNGACLTVVKMENSRFSFDLSRETLNISNFNDLPRGSLLNIELPLTLTAFLSGHLVSGHLDGTVRTRSINRSAERSTFVFTFTRKEWRRFLVFKGSVALNGISLTVSEIGDSSFSVEVIPHTLETTNLKFLKIGDRVNLELDLIGKYIYNQKY
jgi:riboflavin synthase